MGDTKPVIEVKAAEHVFHIRSGLGSKSGRLHALRGVDLAVPPGSSIGIVGESGCGKSTLARLILGLMRPSSGSIEFQGRDLKHLSARQRRTFKVGVQAVFQDPYSSLSPRLRIGDIVSEPLRAASRLSSREIGLAAEEALEEVGLAARDARRYPHEFSGGQRQRIAIARAISVKPALIVLDEPTSSLDVSVRAQVINLLKRLQASHGVAYLVISHDLAMLRQMADVIHVMYLGKVVETALNEDLYQDAQHPYTRRLLDSVLTIDAIHEADSPVIDMGEPASAMRIPSGCPYHTRCPDVMPICRVEEPAQVALSPLREVVCHKIAPVSVDIRRISK